ncbi:epsin-1 isoform X18 [Danio rerio]|uniref:Epsin-1 isoform X18 n=2 Tax=Danio rerio TaxID=7955 RepID=A0AC58HG42_DANRE
MSTSSLRRQVKNIVHNYSEAEIKVREATSNDPWGPSSSLMSEIADLTYNVVAFSEIMSMVWKRLNDHGKNWRHVYKAMTLMEYLIKTGSERVAQQCRENIYAVQTLKDFQYIDRDGKDQGVNVREKAKQLVTLLKDEERLREERIHALKTKEKMAQTSSASSAPSAPALGGGGVHSGADSDQAWPQSSGEEDLQLQLALAMSKEEAEQEERLRRGDDLRLQMAIEESKREKTKPEESSLMELSAADPWGAPATGSAGPSPPPALGPASTAGPWGPPDPWGATSPASPPSADPWAGAPATVAPDPWSDSSSRVNSDPWASTADPERRGSSVTCDAGGGGSTGSPVPFDLSSIGSSLPVRKTPESFLGPNAALVDLDSLVSSKPKPKQPPPPSISSTSNNPFLQTQGPSSTGMGVTPGSTISSRGVSPTPPSASNPFGATPMASISPQPSSLGLNQLRTSPVPPNPMLGHMPPPVVGMVQPGMGMPGMGVPMAAPGLSMGMGMPYGGISPMGPGGNPLLMGPGGPAQPSLILGGPSGVGGVMGTGGSMGGGTTGTSTNPFLL